MDAATQLPSPKFRHFVVSLGQGARLGKFLQGALLASLLVHWVHLMMVTWGISAFTLCSLCLGGLLLAGLAGLPRPPFAEKTGLFGLTFLTISSYLWWSVWDVFLAAGLAHSSAGFVVSCVLNGMLLGLLGTFALWTFSSVDQQNPTTFYSPRKALGLGLAIGLWLVAGGLGLFVAVYPLAVLASLLLLGGKILEFVRTERIEPHKTTAAVVPQPTSPGMREAFWQTISAAVVALLIGGLIPVLYRMVSQLQPETTLLFYGCLASLGLGVLLARRSFSSSSLLLCTLLLALAGAAFPLWLHYYMAISALVWFAPAAMLLRQLGLVVFFLPVGHLMGTAIFQCTADRQSTSLWAQSVRLMGLWLLLCSGYTLSGFGIVAPQIGPASLLFCLLAGLLLLSVCLWKQERNNHTTETVTSKLRWNMAAVALTTGACFAMLWGYQPAFSARTLFSTQAFLAWRDGSSLQATAGLNDGRLLTVRESSQGTLTYWRHQGTHFQIRQNGIPAGRVSGNARLVPQPTGGVLGAVLPLSLHPAPREVLLLGLESGLGMKTVLEFPVMNVTCVEPDAVLLQQAQRGVISSVLQDSLTDDRVTVLPQDQATALRQNNAQYDVVLETPGHSAIYRNAALYDTSHYTWIARRLSPEGLYCQRFIFSDYGPAAIRSLMETLEQSFGYVTAFDTAPGEMLFIAARQKEHVLTAGLLERMAAPQTRRSLAQVGWDWSVAMNLARFELSDIPQVKSSGVHSVWQGTGAFGLAYEMLRWGNKWDEVRAALASQPQRLLEHYAEEKQMEDLLARLADIVSRERMLVQHPDQFWVYRKTVKEKLIEKPRTTILPVKGEGLQKQMHPDDQRRLDYFTALGKATQENPCSLKSLADVEAFAYPYDPIVSYFLHAEIARLYQRTNPVQPDRELAHWLHSLYYGSQQERSVRGIHRSIELLSEAELSLTAEERYDHINSLLELLEIRWQMRKGKQDLSQSVLLLDLKDSLAVAETGLAALEKFGSQAGVSATHTELRQQELERKLVRMLRSHRSEMLAKASKPNPLLPRPESENPSK